MSTIESCLAIIEQGVNKGKQCSRPKLESGYCGKHQKQQVLTKAVDENKKKCLTHRCLNILNESSEQKYCNECIKYKEEKSKESKICIAIIQQLDVKDKQCSFLATHGDYCGKHVERNTLIIRAKEEGHRICDDAKRPCKNITRDFKLKCEECLEKIRAEERKEYEQRKANPDICLGCGIKMETNTEGFRKETVKRCKECYEKLKQTEENRKREERDYNKERKLNLERHYNEYMNGAGKRNILFNLNIEQFEKLVNSHCSYCDIYDEEKVIGIDRVDSFKAYTINNVVPCCFACNMMKGSLSKEEFLSKIRDIYLHIFTDEEFISDTETEIKSTEEKSYIRPRKILQFYVRNKLSDYIELCKKEERSPLFVKKMEELKELKLNENDCIKYIKNALKSDTNKSTKQRISKKELFGYLENKQPHKCIELYTSVHGEVDGFKEDIEEFVKNKYSSDKRTKIFDKILVKYQNLRNRK